MKVHYASEKHDWGTPLEFFNKVNEAYGFRLDACANEHNAKVYPYITQEMDSLLTPWGDGPVWCNPPYGREQIEFIRKADSERGNGTTTVLLIPARPDTAVWQDVIFKRADAVCFVRGRLKFEGAEFNAPFPCALVVFGEVKDLSSLGYVLIRERT